MLRATASLLLLIAGAESVFGAADSALLSLLPANAQMVTSMDVNASRSSTFGQFMLRQVTTDKSLQDLIDQTGFDPRRDLQSFVFATVPSADPKGTGGYVLIARGTFDQTRISATAQSKGMTSESLAGTTVLESTGTNGQLALAFPEVGLAVTGDLADVEQVLTNRANPTVLNADLQAQISKASANSDAWFASILPASTFAGRVGQEMGGSAKQGAQVLQGVLQSSGGLRFGSTVQLTFNALTRSDKDAVSLTDVIRFLSSAIQMQRQSDARAAILAPAMDSMTLKADGRQVYSMLSIPEGDLERLMETKPKSSKSASRF